MADEDILKHAADAIRRGDREEADRTFADGATPGRATPRDDEGPRSEEQMGEGTEIGDVSGSGPGPSFGGGRDQDREYQS